MIAFLRLAGLLNAAVWFGAAVFFTFGAYPAASSEAMKQLLSSNFPYFSGAIAQVFASRYFFWQAACGVLALLHAWAERLYLGRSPHRFWLGLIVWLVALNLMSGLWVQPKLRQLHFIEYASGVRAERRQIATESFRFWHALFQGINLMTVVGLAGYVWHVANPADPTRFVNAAKLPVDKR